MRKVNPFHNECIITEEINLPEASLVIPSPIPNTNNGGISLILRCASANIKADVVIPLKPHSDIKKHWYKLSYFSPLFANQKPNDDIIIMDIDQIIVNNIDDIIGYPVGKNELVSYNKWWGGKPKLNGGFYKFKSGELKNFWSDFIKCPEVWQLNWYKTGVVHYKYYGE